MLRRFLISISLVFLLLPASARSQDTPPEDWGVPVEGVQLRLSIAANLATPQNPAFEVQLRNRNESPVTFVSEALNARVEIQIDGVWYRSAGGGSCCTSPQTVAPGAQSPPLRLMIQDRILFEMDASGASQNQRPSLTPGTHTIRIRTYSNDRINIRVGRPTPRTIILTSNPLMFEVAGTTAPNLR
jgi:hypothetical protein